MSDDDPLEALKRRQSGDDPLEELKRRKRARVPDLAPRESTSARPRPPAPKSPPLAFLAPIAQGLTFGGADEILGAVEGANQALHGGSFSAGYREGRDKVRAGTKQYAEENPATSTALTIGGAIAPAVVSAPASLVRAGAPLLARVGLGAAEGAALGGFTGALSADEDRAAGAASGALVGGALGGALPAAGAGLSTVRNVIGRRGADAARHADQLVTRALVRDKVDPRTLTTLPGKPQVLADLAGENTLGLARGAQATPSEAKNVLAEFLTARQAAQPTRVLGNVEHAAGMETRDVHDVAERLIDQRKANAKPLYDKVRDVVVDDPEVIATIHGSPYLRRAHTIGRQIAREEGVDLPPLTRTTDVGGQVVEEQVPQTVQAIDYTKRGLDALIERKMRGGSMDRSLARILRNKVADMLDRVDSAVPDYQAARAQYAGDSALMDALESGRNFLKEDYRVTQKELARMTDGEREMHKVGALDAIRRTMDEAPDGADVVKRIFGNPRKRDQLHVLFGDQEFATLERQLAAESRMTRTKDRVLGGSPTARIATELEDLGTPGLMEAGQALMNPKAAAARAAVNMIRSRAKGNVGEVANEVSKRVMLSPGSPEYQAWLALLARMQAQGQRVALPQTAARRALIAGVTAGE